MKILQVISSLDPKRGGPSEGLKQMVPALEKNGHTVEVLTLDAPDAPWIEHFPCKVHALGPSFLEYRFNMRLKPWLHENGSAYDSVIINGLWQYHSFGAWRALRNTPIPYFVYTHGMLDPWFRRAYPLKHLKKWLYWPWADYRVLRDARAVLFTSEEERILARETFWLYRCNEAVVNFGISGNQGDPAAQLADFYSQFPALRDKRIWLFLSRIHLKKGCDLLIEAFARVCRQDESLHLVFVGPDQTGWRTELEKLASRLGIAERVTWAGMVSADRKWGAYRAADVFVLPSHSENFGAAVAEALACGLPVLISNKVNIWREIVAYNAGMVENDNLEGTIKLLERWLKLPEDAKTDMRNQSEKCFREAFDITSLVKKLASTISGLSSARDRGERESR